MAKPVGEDLFISSVKVRNYRCFEEATFRFDQKFTVAIGGNGAGKSSVLDALATSVARLASYIGSIKKSRHVEPSDVRQVLHDYGQEVSKELQGPLDLEVSLQFRGELLEDAWTIGNVSAEHLVLQPTSKNSSAKKALEPLRTQVNDGGVVTLPLFAFYGTSRLANSTGKIETLPPGSRLDGYEEALATSNNTRALMQWFKTRELISLQENGDAVLDGVKAALKNCMPEWSSVRYSVRHDQLVASSGEDSPTARTFQTMSDGYRSVLAMVSDIARRAAILNPHLGAEAAAMTPGLVLVDELDLHLHPNWQRRIVSDLKRTFPRLQFVCTTHSPFIVQGLTPGEVIGLSRLEGANAVPAESYVRLGIEDIAEAAMEVGDVQRSQSFHQQRQRAAEYLDAARGSSSESDGEAKLTAMLESLVGHDSDDPYLVARHGDEADETQD